MKIGRFIIITIICIIIICIPNSVFAFDKTLTVAFVEDAKGLPSINYLEELYEVAFWKVGINYKTVFLPARRCSIETDNGTYDGEGVRIADYDKTHPNLVRIETNVSRAVWAGYCHDPNIKINGWKSLKGHDYIVYYRRGVKLCEIKLPLVVKKNNLGIANTTKSGFEMLLRKRIDIFIEPMGIGDIWLNKSDFKNEAIYKCGELQTIPLYLYLHKKHKDLIPMISTVIKEMKKSGEMQRLKEKSGWKDPPG